MTPSTQDSEQTERLRRWRLILGGGEADGICGAEGDQPLNLGSGDMEKDQALAALYDQSGQRKGGNRDSKQKHANSDLDKIDKISI